MHQDAEDISKMVKIREDFLNRNKNLMYGLLKFLVGPILALIMMQDGTRRAFNYEITYYAAYMAAFIVCIYLVIALFFDIYAYLKPLQKVTLSAKQQQMLDWPPNYPTDLIDVPTTTVLETEILKRQGIQKPSSPLPSPLPTSTPAAMTSSQLASSAQQTPVRSQTPAYSPAQQTSAYASTPAATQSSTPVSFITSFLSSPFRGATNPQPTPAPASTSSPFTPSLPQPLTASHTPLTTTSLYPQTPYTFPSPQSSSYTPSQPQTYASPQPSFSSPLYPATTTPYSTNNPSHLSTSSTPSVPLTYPHTPTIITSVPTSPAPLSSPQILASTPESLRRSRFGFVAATPDLATENSLRRYIESVKSHAEKKVSSGTIRSVYTSTQPYQSTISPSALPRYRASFNGPPPRGVITQIQQQAESPLHEEDLYAYQSSALQTLQDEGIANMEEYIERMQEWLGSRLIPYVMLYVDLYLNREKPENQQQWNTFKPHIQEYLDMTAYGFVQPNSADYVAGRIKELRRGAVISQYNWCRGSDGDASSALMWDPRYPCDAQLLIHLFCTFLDLHLVPDPSTRLSNKPFTSKYFVRSPAFPGRNPHPVIYQKHAYPPHFELVLPDNKLWPVQQGYNNLYHTLVCFIFQITKTSNGYLGPISISDAEINLSWVVGD